MSRRAAASLVLAAALTSARAAKADPAYRLDPSIDVPILTLAATVSAAWLLSGQLAPPHCAPVCDKNDLLPIDRWAAGRYRPTLAAVSDATELALLAGGAIVLLADEGLVDGANDGVVVGESVLLSTALAALTTLATRRPRPFVYGTEAPLEKRTDGNAALSFFSGHTAVSFAVTVATARTLARRGRTALPIAVLALGLPAAALVGTTRVLSGNHFPTDVIAGAVVGVSNGFLAPGLHGPWVRVAPGTTSSAAGLSLVGGF